MSNEQKRAASTFLNLRREATPVEFRGLDRSQREAFVRILEALQHAVDCVRDERPGSSARGGEHLTIPSIQRDRLNRSLFLDGDRGTGKTTLLMSMLGVMPMVLEERGEWKKKFFKGMPEGDPHQERAGDLLEKISKSLIWLQPLDIETQPDEFNPLTAIVSRVEEALERARRVRRGNGSDGTSNRGGRGTDVLRMLEEIQVESTLAWMGTDRRRAARIDPDPYSFEVARQARARRDLAKRLEQLLDQAAAEISYGDVDNPIFVLPIDDFDLSPWHCVEVLKVLRFLSIPRLFTLVLGNFEILQSVEELALRGKLSRQAGQRDTMFLGPDGVEDTLDDDIYELARATALDALQKIAPAAQRLKLGEILGTEGRAKDFRIPGSGLTLLNLIGEGFTLTRENCSYFFVSKAVGPGRAGKPASMLFCENWPNEKGEIPNRYVGRYALELTNRRLTDIYMIAEHEGGSEGWLGLTRKLAELAWLYDRGPRPSTRRVFEQWVSDLGRPSEMSEMFPLVFHRRTTRIRQIECGSGLRLEVCKPANWGMYHTVEGRESARKIQLDLSTIGALALFVDSRGATGMSVDIDVAPLVVVDFRGQERCSWLTPTFSSVFEADYILGQIGELIEMEVEQGVLEAERLELIWARLMLAQIQVSKGDEGLDRSLFDSTREVLNSSDKWGALEAILEEVVGGMDAGGPAREWSLRSKSVMRFIIWLAPENGLTKHRSSCYREALCGPLRKCLEMKESLLQISEMRNARKQVWESGAFLGALLGDQAMSLHYYASRLVLRKYRLDCQSDEMRVLSKPLLWKELSAFLEGLPDKDKAPWKADMEKTTPESLESEYLLAFGASVVPESWLEMEFEDLGGEEHR